MYEAANDGCADRLALASVLRASKSTPRAVGRCKKRVQRALGALVIIRPRTGAPCPTEAIEAIRRTCMTCGRCGDI